MGAKGQGFSPYVTFSFQDSFSKTLSNICFHNENVKEDRVEALGLKSGKSDRALNLDDEWD